MYLPNGKVEDDLILSVYIHSDTQWILSCFKVFQWLLTAFKTKFKPLMETCKASGIWLLPNSPVVTSYLPFKFSIKELCVVLFKG